MPLLFRSFFFFFNDTATTEIYTLSLHDALPIYVSPVMVIPGPYTDRELAFQAEDVASALTYNASFDCNAAKVVITAKGWPLRETFLRHLDSALAGAPQRQPYYPGARERWEAFTAPG